MANKKKPVKRKGGRKPLWEELDMPSRLDMVKGWAMQGSTDAEIFEMLGVGKNVFYQWKRDKPEFKEALKKGRHDSNGEILKSAFKQTQGYYVTEQQAVKIKRQVPTRINNTTYIIDEEEVQVVDIQKFIPPNTSMTIFMLKNRLPEFYKDKPSPKDDQGEVEGDGFKEALSATADDVWKDEKPDED